MDDRVDMVDLLDAHFMVSMQDKRTSFPAKIVKADIQSGKCTVQPIHKFKIIETGQEIKPALIEDVPIIFQRSAGSIDILPLKKGDVGQCIVSDRSISEWLSGSGTEIFPENPNIMEGSQCSFLPGGYPFAMTFGNGLPENTRSIIVKPGTKQFFGNPSIPLSVNGGTLEIWNILKVIVTILQADDMALYGLLGSTSPNIAAFIELLAAIPQIQIDP